MNLSKSINFNFLSNNYIDLGNKFFLIGIFLLPSALPISGLFLLISIFISFALNKNKFLLDKWNILLCLSIFLILISNIYNSFINPTNLLQNFEKSIIWINLFNWIPIYFAYLGFQIYLKTDLQRVLFKQFLIAGTVPVIASCIMQKFGLYGPFETLYGTIVWFNYKLGEGKVQSITGLFNNPNYLGIWLTMCLPFAMSAIRFENKNIKSKIFLYLITFSLLYFSLMTNSRNAVLGIIISFLFISEKKKLFYFLLFFLTSLILFGYLFPYLLNLNQFNSSDISQPHLLEKFSSLDLIYEQPRIKIWKNTVDFIYQRPILGWGAATFSEIYNNNVSLGIPFQKYQHTHNMFLELAYNFGIPAALTTISTIVLMFVQAFKKVIISNNFTFNNRLDKDLIASFAIFLVAHSTDITYYDGKISIFFAVLLAYLKNIIEDNKKIKNI